MHTCTNTCRASRAFALPALLCVSLAQQSRLMHNQTKTPVDEQNFQGKLDWSYHQQWGLAEEKRTFRLCVAAVLQSIQKNTSFCWNIIEINTAFILLPQSGRLCAPLRMEPWWTSSLEGSCCVPMFEMVANAKSSLMVGSLNIGQTQDVYDLLPRSVSETNVCTGYHRVLTHKHYRWLISHKSDEILFP